MAALFCSLLVRAALYIYNPLHAAQTFIFFAKTLTELQQCWYVVWELLAHCTINLVCWYRTYQSKPLQSNLRSILIYFEASLLLLYNVAHVGFTSGSKSSLIEMPRDEKSLEDENLLEKRWWHQKYGVYNLIESSLLISFSFLCFYYIPTRPWIIKQQKVEVLNLLQLTP